MKNSKRSSKYNLSFKFLTDKRPYFPSPKSLKQELFSNQQILFFHQRFGSKEDRILHFEKARNKNF